MLRAPLFILASLFIFISCKKTVEKTIVQNPNEPIYSLQDGFDFQALAVNLFNKEPRKSADAFLKATSAFLQNNRVKDAGVCLGNAAHLYEEYFDNLDSALMLSKQGLEYSLKANDTFNIGHGHRYTGYLMGMTGKMDEGVAEIEKSKPKYVLRNNKDAIAVADYDIARVYSKGGLYDKADLALTKSSEFFKEKMNLQRLFNNNIFGLELYKLSGNTKKYEMVKAENDQMIANGKISETLIDKYKKALNK